MRVWKVKINEKGKELRNLIDDNDSIGVVLKLREICDILINTHMLKKFEELYLLLEGEDDIIKNETFGEYDWESTEELVDSRLEEFWDLCDYNDVFIGF